MKVCKKLHELPSVAIDWQQTTWCPDCDFYDLGACGNPERTGSDAPCPFDGKPLPLREVAGDPYRDRPQKTVDAASRTEPESPTVCAALEQAIKQQIARRTGGRIQMLEVEVRLFRF